MSQPTPIDQPTRRTVESLLRDLLRECDNIDEREEYRELERECERLRDEFMATPKMKAAVRKREAAWKKLYQKAEHRKTRVRTVRQLYQANGLTADVRKALDGLLREFRPTRRPPG